MRLFESIPDLKIGSVVETSGTAVKVEMSGDVSELTRGYDGRVYLVGQLGSIVKIHFGRRVIFGFVTLLRMRSEEDEKGLSIPSNIADERVMEVEIFGEGSWDLINKGLVFARGVNTYPLPNQGVYLLTKEEARELYAAAEGASTKGADPLVPFAYYAAAEATPCRANIDKMFGLHCAVLGSTGSGKSGAVAAILHSVIEHRPVEQDGCYPRIVIIDPHGEYSAAFGEKAVTFRAYDAVHGDEHGEKIQLPYWLMSADEFRALVIGKTEYEATTQNNVIYKALAHARLCAAGLVERAPDRYGIDLPDPAATIDAPVLKDGVSEEVVALFDWDRPYPFSLIEFENHIRYAQAARASKAGVSEKIADGEFVKNYKSVLDKLSVLKRDPRIRFLMQEWDAVQSPTLAAVICQFAGEVYDGVRQCGDVRIVDISGLPNEVAGPLAAMIARLLFQYKLYQSREERERDPMLLVCEEAHRYVPAHGEAQYAAAQTAVRRIAREGRKYGLGLMLVSQRPADIEGTVISQCGTWIILRLTNSADQQHVSRFLPDGLVGMTSSLAGLGQQEAIFVGEGASLPARIRIRDLPREKLPRSQSVSYAAGWGQPRLSVPEVAEIATRMAGMPQVPNDAEGALPAA